MLNFPEDKFITVNDRRVRYWQEGDSGPFLLMVHGLGASVEYWHKNIFEFAKHYRVIAVDLPGFGKSEKSNNHYDLEFYARFLRSFTDALNINEAHIIGHSMGGGIALQFCIANRSKVKKLVLIDCVGFAQQVIIFFRLMGLPFVGKFFINLSKAMFTTALRKNVYHSNVITDELIDIVYPLIHSPDTRQVIEYITRDETNIFGITKASLKPLWDNYDKLSQLPILIYWGKQDVLLHCETHVKKAKEMLPHAEIELFDECGHIPQMEYPEKFHRLSLDFLNKN